MKNPKVYRVQRQPQTLCLKIHFAWATLLHQPSTCFNHMLIWILINYFIYLSNFKLYISHRFYFLYSMWILAILAALGKLARPPRLDMEIPLLPGHTQKVIRQITVCSLHTIIIPSHMNIFSLTLCRKIKFYLKKS